MVLTFYPVFYFDTLDVLKMLDVLCDKSHFPGYGGAAYKQIEIVIGRGAFQSKAYLFFCANNKYFFIVIFPLYCYRICASCVIL